MSQYFLHSSATCRTAPLRLVLRRLRGLALCGILLIACVDTGVPPPLAQSPTGSAKLRIATPPASLFALLADRAFLAVSGPGMTPIVSELFVADSSIDGTVESVPSGPMRRFSVAVYDHLDIMRYRGEAVADVVPDSVLRLDVTLIPHAYADSATDTLPSAALLARYTFSGDARDVSGHGHDGQMSGVVHAQDRLGRPRSALWFGGSSAVIIPYSPSLDFTTGPFTVCAWLNADMPGYDHRRVFDHRDPSGTDGWALLVNQSDVQYVGTEAILAPCTLGVKRWRLLTVVHRPDSLLAYLDGALFARTAALANSGYSGGLRIGAAHNGTGGYMGRIDDIRIYGRELSARECEALFREHGSGL